MAEPEIAVRVPVYEKTLEIYAGDFWFQQLALSTAADYTDFKAQWRAGEQSPVAVDLDVDVDGTIITLSALPEKTRQMLGYGLIDVQATLIENPYGAGPKTFMRFITDGGMDITR